MHINVTKIVFRNPWFVVGAGLFIFFAVISLVGPFISPYDPFLMDFDPISAPCAAHPLGVNDCGQDILSELLCAVRNTVFFGVTCAAISLFIGVFVGLVAGWFGGIIDMVLMRFADILLAVPSIMVLILISALFRPPPLVLAVILALIMWPTISKAIRAQTLIVRKSLHVRAAVQVGAQNRYILFRHLLPELFPLYLIGFSGKCRAAMFMEASLAFMGLIDPGRKSLGMMIHYALKYYYMDIWWNWLLPPVACLSLLIMTVTFILISLEKVLDPRLRESIGEFA